MKTPDRQRLLNYLKSNQNREVNAFVEIVNGLHILEYTGRLTDARKMIGCVCSSGLTCTSLEHIINTRKGYYKYINHAPKEDFIERSFMYTLDEMQQKREELIKKLKEARKNGDVELEKLITAQGKAIRYAIDREQIKIGLF